jgi:hypothetical protein
MADLDPGQPELSERSHWDFSDLRALYVNCTLKRSPAASNTRGLAARYAAGRWSARGRHDDGPSTAMFGSRNPFWHLPSRSGCHQDPGSCTLGRPAGELLESVARELIRASGLVAGRDGD